MIVGQRQTVSILRQGIQASDRIAWFHAASLGEFEQGRPLMERLRREHPEYKILLTFFSPSGYEVRKNYQGADIICYLPFDTPRRAKRFLRLAHPEIGVFIKYEFWQNYLMKAHRQGTRLYSVSSIFRPNQHFFKWWGNSKPLRQFDHLFVQNETSRQLLAQRNITCVTIVGDTRFDRVIDIRTKATDLPLVERFVNKAEKVFIAGSSWEPDEDIYLPYLAEHPDWKLIIAPHVVNENRIAALQQRLQELGMENVTYTHLEQATQEQKKDGEAVLKELLCGKRVLIVNSYGKLSSIYRYATVAEVGGGFGVGIHNVPEAAVYGIPVLIGPNNHKFREAQALLKSGGAFEFTDAATFAQLMDRFASDPAFLSEAGKQAGDYIQRNAGAAAKCYEAIFNR